MKIFLDTNVLVSAFATRGLCADLFRVFLGEHELVVGEVVLAALRRVLRERIKLPRAMIGEIVGLLREHTVVAKPRRHLGLGLADRDDEWVVASAVAGGADLLVTGDAELLAASDRAPVAITSPRGLWEILRGRPAR